ncbi:hypothetical protein DA802_17530 [Shouchella clausii]|nr:hypothetical protein DA802_17530 [Shouchella clausii]
MRFTCFSVRGNEKVKKEMGFALLAVNLRKYTARNNSQTQENQKSRQKGVRSSISVLLFI